MKVCFLIANISGKGGTERVTAVIANGLIEQNVEVGIISCRGEEKSFFLLNENIRLHFLHNDKINNSIIRKEKSYKNIWKIVSDNKYDVAIAVDVYLYLYLFPLQIAKKCQCLAWEHFNYYISSKKISNLARSLAIRYADQVIVLGKNDFENYQKHYPKAKNLTYIYNPIAFKRTDPENIDIHRIITAGRLAMQKGFDMLIEAWKIIEQGNPNDDWVLDIYGSGKMQNELQNSIDEYYLKRCHLRGYTDDIESEMKKSSIFVLSSRYEGFVLVLLEAQAKGLPCVSFNCKEGPAEIIDDGVNGFLVEEGNVVELASKLQKLMSDDECRREFAQNSQKDLRRFEESVVIGKWKELLSRIAYEKDSM